MNPRLIISTTAAAVLALASVIPGFSQSSIGTMADRLGTDDGYALIVNFSGDMTGNIDNCGCKSRLMGGVVWRAGYVEALSKATGGQVPLLQVDVGHSLADSTEGIGTLEERRVKNDFVLRAFDTLHLDVANVSHYELQYLEERMRATDYAKNLERFPALGAFISANITPVNSHYKAFKPYVIREVKGARLGAAPIRVGFVGLSETPLTVSGPGRDMLGNYRIQSALEVAKKVVPELRAKCDVLVVLAYTNVALAKSIGAAVPGIDAIVIANQYGYHATSDDSNGTIIAYATTQTKWLGELRFYPNPNTPARPFSSVLQRSVALDAVIPADPSATKLVEEARAAIAKFQPSPVGAE